MARKARAERIAERRAEVFPLNRLPRETREGIATAVAADTPPPRWLRFELCQMESRAWYEWHWERGIDPQSRREDVPKRLRQLVIERDGYVCQLCGGDVEPGDVHIDHIKPWSKGGPNVLGNLQVAHSVCNMRKGARFDVKDSHDQA